MKKIILAVASVLALGLVVGCKQQLEGSLNVTSTTYTKSLDQETTKTFYYTATGTVTETSSRTVYQKTGNYNSYETKTTNEFTPKAEVKVVEKTNPLNDSITYTVTLTGDVKSTQETTSKISSSADPVKYKYINDKDSNSALSNVTRTITITKTNGKFYYALKDGSYKVVEGVDFSAATVDLSKFSDTTSASTVSYSGATYNTTTDNASATPTDYTSKTTDTASGYVIAVTLTRK